MQQSAQSLVSWLLSSKQLDGLSDCLIEYSLVLASVKNLIERQVNDHTSDLASKRLIHLANAFIKQVANVSFLLGLI